MGFTIKHIFLTVYVLVAMNVIIDASLTEFDLFVLSRSTNYRDAVDLCRRHRMRLVKIEDEETNQMVYNLAVKRNLGQYWIDANDIRNEGLWVYSNRNRIVYNKWYPGEPNNLGNEDCVHGLRFSDGYWNDINCNITITAICYAEKPTVDIVTIEESQLVPLQIKVDFFSAVHLCKLHGMNLIKIQNEETNREVYNYAVRRGLREYWIDANDITTEGLWVDNDGNRIVYNKWYYGEPNDLGNEDCAHGSFFEDGFWNDISCNRNCTPICYAEKSHVVHVIIEEDQLMHLDEKADYDTALFLCEQHGMHLVKVQNEDTNIVVFNYAVDKGIGEYWMDANDITTEGLWVYNDGNPIVYNKWHSGEPNNLGDEDCATGLLFPDGFWNDAPCNIKLTVICYKN